MFGLGCEEGKNARVGTDGFKTPPEKILVLRPSALGDVCRTVPVVAGLKRAFPHAVIDWVVQDSFVEAVTAHPAVRRVIPFPRKRFSGWWKPSVGREVIAWLSSLRRERYDVVLDCQGLARSGLFAWCSRAPVRVGYTQAAEGAWLASTRRVDAPIEMHAVDRMMRLVEDVVGAAVDRDMRLYSPVGAWERLRAQMGSDAAWLDGRYAVVAPTSRWPGKLWPSERYAAVVKAMDQPTVIVGSEHERGQCRALLSLCRENPNVVDAIGKTSIGMLMALVERSGLVIGSDSACVHMAVGFDRPLVALYGPTDAARVGPYRREHGVVQCLCDADRYDHKDEAHGRAMMQRITVQDVQSKIEEVLGSRRSSIGSHR